MLKISFFRFAILILPMLAAYSTCWADGVILAQEVWTEGNQHEYVVVQLQGESWDSVRADAESTVPGAHLATITSQAEQDFIADFVCGSHGGEWWIGGFQEPPDEPVPDAGWTWVTEEPWIYTNWGGSEPNDTSGRENHVTIQFSGCTWNDEGSAISAVRGYVAEYSDLTDTDDDGWHDVFDNCTLIANPDQRDTDTDGIGNACDADFEQNCIVNYADLGIMKAYFFTAGDFDTDLNGDGWTNFSDLSALKTLFLQPPGPSGLPNLCQQENSSDTH